jgi:hypothetical protein
MDAELVRAVLGEAVAELHMSLELNEELLHDRVVEAVNHELTAALQDVVHLEAQLAALFAAEGKHAEGKTGPPEGDVTARSNLSAHSDASAASVRSRISDARRRLEAHDGAAALSLDDLRLCLADATQTALKLMRGSDIIAKRLKKLKAERAAAASAAAANPTAAAKHGGAAQPLLQAQSHPLLQQSLGAAQDFIQLFETLIPIYMSKMSMSQAEESAVTQQLEDLLNKDAQGVKKIAELRARLETDRTQHREQVQRTDEHIQRLQLEIALIQKTFEEKQTRAQAQFAAKAQAAQEEFVQREKDALTRVAALREQLRVRVQTSDAEELTHHRRKMQKEDAVGELVTKYDADMAAKDLELRQLRDQYEAETKERLELEAHFALVDAENARIADERRRREEARRHAEEKHRLTNEAAVVFQKLYRSFLESSADDGKKQGSGSKKSEAGKRSKK